jgi:quercetin dioxygenase-like cupin family protein
MFTSFISNFIITFLSVAVFNATTFSQKHHAENEDFKPVLLENLEWFEYQSPGFGPGLVLTVVHGDPAVPDEPYVLRASFPDGYIIPPHIHPRAENLTMLSGKLLMGKGRNFDESKLESYKAGDFLYIPGEHPHFGRTVGPTVFQLHGIGPFQTILIEDIVGER